MSRWYPCVCGLMLVAAAQAQAAERPPNILLIFADDLGWKDVGYQGSDYHETPRIDQLAREGMVFTNGYASAGNCAPSRACLLSGQYTPRHEVYAVGDTNRGPHHLQRLIPIPNKSGLAPANVTVAEALKAAGYTTGIFGKWHSAGRDGTTPDKQGFDVVFDPRPNANARRDEPEDPKGIFSLTREAGQFIEANRERPWFAYVAHHAIHTALEAKPASLQKFSRKPAGAQHHAPLYAACTYDLDDGVGKLLDRLHELGLDEQTLVVFTSDNGGTQQSSQEPLRGSKGGYYEGGIREPFIVRWPGKVAAGSRCDVPVINVDLYPTFLAAARAKVPEGKILDGESLLPLLMQSGPLQREAIFWHFPGYLDSPVIRGRDPVFRTRPVSVIRKGDWKLHLYHEEWNLDGGLENLAANRCVELYNLADDLGEQQDLALAQPQRLEQLLGELRGWFAATEAKLPTQPNPTYAPDGPQQKSQGRSPTE